jgi:uncharacterized membrane protein
VSAVIYAAIVVMWAVVLVPMWLRRHDDKTESRSVDRFSTAMRTLSRRTTSGPGRRYVVMPRRGDGGVSVHVSGAAVAPAEPTATKPRVARVRPFVKLKPRRATSLVARRRRLFLGLAVVTFFTFVLAIAGVFSWLLQIVLDVFLVAFCIHLRAQARRAAAVARQRRRASRADGAGAAVAPSARQAPVGQRPRPRPAMSHAAAAFAAPQREAYAPVAEESLEATGTDDDTWEPVPVPRPTYTLKPPAPVEVPIDLIDPLRDTDPYNSMAAASYDDLPAPGAEVIAAAGEELETDLDDILQRRWA